MADPLALPFFSRVALGADYGARLERFTAVVGAELARREGGGRSALDGHGLEFTGHRPYRAGDDPRSIDWSVTARSDRPFVRLSRRDARERWRIAVDTSASMGVGPPGKLQRAAEVAGAFVLLGVRRGAEVELAARGRPLARFHRRVSGTLARLVTELEAWTTDAPGASGPRSDGAAGAFDPGGALRGVARFVWLGDPFASAPRAFFEACERVPARHVLHLCAPHELVAPAAGAIEWRDAESERALAIALDAGARGAYARELEARIADWSDAARRHGARHACASSARPFEDLARAALGA
ncbi:MAG: DUF58 domain-containing protein [Planctomycetes bacterium]|nr:DUF58 domain-containing protein [Planctomycetota bacterium]